MPTSIELRQERARVVESMRAITEAAEAENRNLSGEEREQFDRHEEDFRSFGERIERMEALEERERANAVPLGREPGSEGGAGDSPEERGKAQRSAFAQFLRRGLGALVPEQRALVQNSAGEILVPEDLEAEIIRSVPALTIVRGLASQRTISTNRVRRRSMDEVSVGWGKLETNQQTLQDSMPSTPTEEYTYIEDLYGLAKVGEDEFDDTDVNLESYITDSFSRAVAEAEDTGFTVGSGHASQQPVGFMTVGGGVSTYTGSATTYAGTTTNAPFQLIDDLKALIYGVPAQYRRNGQFVMSSATELFLSTTKDKNDQYYWQPSVQAGRPNTFLGYGLNNQEDMSGIAADTRIAIFGDFKAGYRVYDRLGMTVQRLVELYSEDGMVGFKIRRRVTGDVVRPDAFRILKTHS